MSPQNNLNLKVNEPRNTAGRDFIVADLHGSYYPLMRAMERVKFDPSRDRLFSVGDLVDRGPNSLECLRLLRNPWFKAVKGNHESMLLQYMGIQDNFFSYPSDFIRNGGTWVNLLTREELNEVRGICEEYLADMPLVRTIEHLAGDFDIAHAELYYNETVIPDSSTLLADTEGALLWGRDLIYAACSGISEQTIREWSASKSRAWVKAEPAILPEKRITYVGHTILNVPILTHSHFFIDGGSYRAARNNPDFAVELFDHSKVMEWVKAGH